MLTFNQFSGSPYHTGLALGKIGASAMHDIVVHTPFWEQLLEWRESEQLRGMQDRVQQLHPYIWDELQGLARGLELPSDDVFLWNCHNEFVTPDTLDTHAAVSVIPETTTIMMPTPDGPRISYQLCGDPTLADHCGIAEFVVDQGPAFAAFVYPGMLPGHSFAVTDTGLTLAVNAIPMPGNSAGIPAIVLTRALLNTAELSHAVQLLNDTPRSGSAHLGLAQRGGSALLGIEFNTENVSIQHAKTPLLHTNHLTHESTQSPSQIVSPSSGLRLEHGATLMKASEPADPLHILAGLNDLSGQALAAESVPQSDRVVAARCLVTADLHIGADAVYWDIFEHADEPARFRMRDATHI